MKLPITPASAHLEVHGDETVLILNGVPIPLPSKKHAVALALTTDSKPIYEAKKKGCQSAASRKKLSESLKKYHANKRRRLRAAEKKENSPRRNGSSSLVNGVGSVSQMN